MTPSAPFPYFWADLKSPDFDRLNAAAAIAVLPVAAIEQHGPHLPLSVDTDLVNGVIDIVGRELRARFGLTVLMVNTFSLPLPAEVKQLFGPDEERFGVHGGDVETSMMLALHPHKVDMALAQNFHSSSQDRAQTYAILGNGSSAKLAWAAQDLHAAGAAGNAAAATAEKGQAVLQASGQALARLLQEVRELKPLA
jgi:creatinine amidohydrolase